MLYNMQCKAWAFLAYALVLLAFPAGAQSKFTLSGYVKDAKTGEEIIGATVYVEELKNGTVTNVYGFYSLTLAAGTYTLSYSFVGYGTLTQTFSLSSNTQFNAAIEEMGKELEEITVSGEKDEERNVRSVTMSRDEIKIAQVKKLPALMGEPDIIKNVQIQPGVISAGEGTSAYFVRGGSADQNMILLDEAPVYDPSHLFGLFSVFNADVLKNSELYKGGIPAKFGGRLSSFLDVRTKDGNNQQLSGSFGLGAMASRAMLEGPLFSDKASFIVSGRRSYVDLITRLAGDPQDVAFYDLNAKINWKPTNKDRFFVSAYLGRDNFGFPGGGSFGWGNNTATFRWNHLFSDRLFSNTTVVYSNFDYALGVKDEVQGFNWKAGLQELALKQDMSFFVSPTNEISFGLHATYHRFSPGHIKPEAERPLFTELELDRMHAIDYAVYAGHEFQVGSRLSVQYGLRLSVFQNTGEGTLKEYADKRDNVDPQVVGERHYGMFEPIKTFVNPEPRLGLRYGLNENSALKASYHRMVQYIHLISNSTVPIPFNTWAPSSPYLDPQVADQVAVGYFRNFQDNTYELSVEAYLKDMRNVTDFADNAQLFFNENIATEYRQGMSDSYGLEFKLSKNKGRLTGFAGYTWSRTERTVPGVNNGKAFLADYDRRHVFNVSGVYELGKRTSIGATWAYYTGRPITLPAGRYVVDGYNVNYYTERNGYKLPDFHRLDISLTLDGKKNSTRKWKSSTVFAIYNVYNRKNPFTIYTRVTQDDKGNIIGDGSDKEARLVYLFPFLPSVTYNIWF